MTREMASPCAQRSALVTIGDMLVRRRDRSWAVAAVTLAEEANGATGNGSERVRALVEIAPLQFNRTAGRGRAGCLVTGVGRVRRRS